MKESIFHSIKQEAEKTAEKFHLYHNYLEIEYQRKKRRLNSVSTKEVKKPPVWSENKRHNPFYVLKHAKKLSKVIADKILKGTYVPHAPVLKEIEKKGGGTRTISIYELPDSAVSDKFYHDLLRKNKHRFSSFAYAYRNDRNVHFAIQDIANELKQCPRIFIAEFDFSNFFGSISQEFLKTQLTENCFSVSATEEKIIEAFLSTTKGGIPLGTSISLFLANLACWKLDRKLEDEGLRFARYADDTIIWTKDYSKICKAFDIINEFSKETGIAVNYEKSDGISLLQNEGLTSEFANHKKFVEFLGYQVSVENISIKKKSVNNIKKQISHLLMKNLILPLKTAPIQAKRFPTRTQDADFLTAISEIRRYLYGNLTEQTLKKFMNGTYQRLSFKGIMSFYPLVDDGQQMKDLDRWLVSTILNVLRKRKKLLSAVGYSVPFFPFTSTGDTLISDCKARPLHQIPSFFRIHLALKLGIKNLGIERVMHPDSSYYESD